MSVHVHTYKPHKYTDQGEENISQNFEKIAVKCWWAENGLKRRKREIWKWADGKSKVAMGDQWWRGEGNIQSYYRRIDHNILYNETCNQYQFFPIYKSPTHRILLSWIRSCSKIARPVVGLHITCRTLSIWLEGDLKWYMQCPHITQIPRRRGYPLGSETLACNVVGKCCRSYRKEIFNCNGWLNGCTARDIEVT